jgi:hypothetical protein
MNSEIIKGLLLGLLANAIGIYLYCFLVLPVPLEDAYTYAIQANKVGGIIAIGAILNLVLFFFLLQEDFGFAQKQSKPLQARGVLLATIIAAMVVLFLTLDDIL